MRSDIAPGASFPDYELPDHEDVPRRLTELQGDDPMILTLARGHYCPKEHQQHLELAAFYPKIAVVLGPPLRRRPLARPAGGHGRGSSRLGPQHAGAARGVGRRRRRRLPRLEQVGPREAGNRQQDRLRLT